MRSLIGLLVVMAMLAAVGVLAARYFKPAAASEIPTVAVHRGDFLVKTYARGDLRAVRSAVIVSPNIGGTLLITELASTGAFVKEGEVALAFDPAELQNNLATHQSTLTEAQQEITKNRAEAAVREQNDKVELLKAEFAVRRAELDVSRNELVSEIEAKKNLLTLEAARKRLAQLNEDVQSRAKSSDAELAVAREKANKAALDLKQAQHRIEQITIKSPMSGLVSVRSNRFAIGGWWAPGIDIPDYRVGDQAFAGDPVLEVVDTSQMEVSGKINEVDRGNIKEGQEVVIRLDAMPGETFPGKVRTLAGMASRVFFGDPSKSFDVVFSMANQDPRLRPGLSAEAEIITERLRDVAYVPAQAVFEKENKKWAYVRRDGRFERREVTAGRRSESQVVIVRGLSPGEQVALLDPENRAAAAKRGKNPLSAGPAGR